MDKAYLRFFMGGFANSRTWKKSLISIQILWEVSGAGTNFQVGK